MAKAIVRDPDIMHGIPVFRGTRVPVQTLFDYLEGGDRLEDFLQASRPLGVLRRCKLWKKPNNYCLHIPDAGSH